MSWIIQENKGAIVVEMNSNKANLHNPKLFKDFHEAFDQMEQQYPHAPVIITGQRNIFSAGIDFNYCFSLFQSGNVQVVADWFAEYRGMMLRLLTSPRLTVAAINGHTYAGGAIFALCCDFRIAAHGNYKISINEVPVGVPMPSVYTEIIRFRLGNVAANETILSGEAYDLEKAEALGFFKKIVPQEQLIPVAIEQARVISPDSYLAYRHSKKMLQLPVLQSIQDYSSLHEAEMFQNVCAPESLRAQRAALGRLGS